MLVQYVASTMHVLIIPTIQYTNTDKLIMLYIAYV